MAFGVVCQKVALVARAWKQLRDGAPRCLSETVAGRVATWALLHGSGAAVVGADFTPALLTCRSCHPPAWTVEHVSDDSCTCSRRSTLQGCAAYSFSLRLKSQADVLRAGSCGMLNGTVVRSGCGRVCGDRFPCFCLYGVRALSVYWVSPRLVRWPKSLTV